MRMIHKTKTGYEIEHFDSEAAEIIRLFGTAVLPLPFGPNADSSVVLADQQKRYTGAVYLCDCIHHTPQEAL